MNALKSEVRRYLEENFVFGADGPAFGDADSLIEHRILDSTGFMELIAFLEETYTIKVLDDEMLPDNLDSVERIAEFVSRKRAS